MFAKPKPGLEYNYEPPTSYGVPLGSRLAGGAIDLVIPNLDTEHSIATLGLQAPILEATNFRGSSDSFGQSGQTLGPFVSSISSVSTSPLDFSGQFVSDVKLSDSSSSGQLGFGSFSTSTGYPTVKYETSSVSPIQISSNAQSDVESFGLGYSGTQVRPENSAVRAGFNVYGTPAVSNLKYDAQKLNVQKNFYFFTAPDEPAQIRQRINIANTTPQKNYKIIFIKTPSLDLRQSVNIPALPQNQEKTIVYVLVKKPEALETINVQAPLPTPPSKPEVYFIKYRTEQEAQDAIENASNGGQVLNRISTEEQSVTNAVTLSATSAPLLQNTVSPSPSVSILNTGFESTSKVVVNERIENEDEGISTSIFNAGTTTVTPHKVYGPPTD